MKNALEWDLFYKFNPQGGPWENEDGSPDDHVVDFINRYNFKSNSLILDCGCADGKNSKFLIEQGFNTYGIDISPTVIKRVKNKLPAGKFYSMSIMCTNFDSGMFDTLIDAGALHVNNPELHRHIFEEYHRILKNSGIMFIRIFSNETVDQQTEIFHVVPGMPVYGASRQRIDDLISGLFTIDEVIFDPNYGSHGHGCNYFYLKKI